MWVLVLQYDLAHTIIHHLIYNSIVTLFYSFMPHAISYLPILRARSINALIVNLNNLK